MLVTVTVHNACVSHNPCTHLRYIEPYFCVYSSIEKHNYFWSWMRGKDGFLCLEIHDTSQEQKLIKLPPWEKNSSTFAATLMFRVRKKMFLWTSVHSLLNVYDAVTFSVDASFVGRTTEISRKLTRLYLRVHTTSILHVRTHRTLGGHFRLCMRFGFR